MSATIRSLVIPVSDLAATKAVYTALLGTPHTDEAYYVGYNVDGFEVALNPAGAGGGPVAFADVDDLDGMRATLLAAGLLLMLARARSRGCTIVPRRTLASLRKHLAEIAEPFA